MTCIRWRPQSRLKQGLEMSRARIGAIAAAASRASSGPVEFFSQSDRQSSPGFDVNAKSTLPDDAGNARRTRSSTMTLALTAGPVLICALLAGCGGVGSVEPAPSVLATSLTPQQTLLDPSTLGTGYRDILVPASGALLGHYYGAGTLAETDARIGRRPQIHLTYYGWTDDWINSGATRSDVAQGRIPLVNWEPFDVDFNDIISGKYDAVIRARADGAKALHAKFFLDFAAEMNEGEGWGGHDPQRYVAAYRHIHDIFVQRGAANAIWAWCPNNVDSDGAPKAAQYYPGDAYVDWTGVDGYNWGTSVAGYGWESFRDVFVDIYPVLAAKRKPIIVGEMASDEVGGSKAEWIDDIVPTLKTTFPKIKAIVWFDIKKERHWQINSSTSSLAAYRRMAKDPYFHLR